MLARVYWIAIDQGVLDPAATPAPTSRMRSRDDLHLVIDHPVGADVRAVVTCDRTMALVGPVPGLTVESPG